MKRLILIIVALLARPAAAQFERHLYTDDKMKIMRENVENHDWARSKRNSALGLAETYAKYSDPKLRSIVVPPQVPRGYQVHNFGCPIHGIKVHEKGLYKWNIDIEQPWKVKCPVGGEMYPSNDFGAYLKSGMKDRSLLTGDYADDGWGWHKPDDEVDANYWFVAYYAHWSMMRYLRDALIGLGQGTIHADDPDKTKLYAHKCAVVLWQLAEYYPDYEYSKQSREGKEHNPNYTGKWTNMIWEVYTPDVAAPAYDAIRPFLKDDVALQQMTGMTGEQIDQYIRDRVLMEAARCITDGSGRIRGNYGMHQQSLITLAIVLDEKEQHPTSQEMIDWILTNPNPRTTLDVGLRDALENVVYRDGVPYESPGYNMGWVNNLANIASKLAEFGVNCYEQPRFRRLMTWPFDMQLCGQFTPAQGDSGDTLAGPVMVRATTAMAALPHMKDARLAAAARQGGGSASDVFAEPSADILDDYPEDEAPPIGLDSHLFPAYGLAHLQTGSDENRTALSFSFSTHPGHRHADQLNITFYSLDNALLTDIGYPEQTDAFNHKRSGYFSNTIAHNTVTVDAKMQPRRSHDSGKLHAYQPNGFAKLVDASCSPYPGVDVYRRANLLMDVSPTQSYLFDAFYVRGGSQHDFSAHGTQADLHVEPALGPSQAKGTLAGENVPYEKFFDDDNLRDKPLGSVSYGGYSGSGFQFFTNVRRAPLKDRSIFDWRLTEPLKGQRKRQWEGIGLRAHAVGNDEELIACEGPLQKYDRNPKTIGYMMRRRTGSAGEKLASRFVTVYEPYKGKTWIKQVSAVKIEPDDGHAAAAKVELADGSHHYVFHSMKPGTSYRIDDKITVDGQAAAVIIDASGGASKTMLFNGTQLRMSEFKLEGHGARTSDIRSIDDGVVELADPIVSESLREGQALTVATDTFVDCLTFRSRVDDRRFSIGAEDLLVAGGTVLSVDTEKKQVIASASPRYAQIGMAMLNALGKPVGRVTGINDKTWTLDRDISMDDFPTAEGDAGPRYRVVMAAPGDAIVVPDLVIYEK